MKIRFLFLLTISTLLTWSADGQTPTSSDTLPGCRVTGDFLERNLDPQLLNQMNAQWQEYQKQNKANGRLSAEDPIITVPVMFHIAHLGEPVGVGSNLSVGQIQASLARLNNIFRARGNSAAGNDTRIEFVLANCSGIDRANASGVADFVSQGVKQADNNQIQQVKGLFGNYQDKFVNIYVSHTITGAGGFAWFGGDMFTTIYDFSKTGERASKTFTFAHEMGHVLFLRHTFEGDNSCQTCPNENVICPPNNNPLTDGDQVADTPPHRVFDLNQNTPATAINYCTGQPFGVELVKNYMAYGTDADRFTPGQIARMRFHLENYLTRWTQSDAIPNPNNQITFSSVPTTLCANSTATISFSNNSGSANPVLLLTKGDEVVNYYDNINSPFAFNVPTGKFDLGYASLLEGNGYRLRVVAGCNSKETAALPYKNLSLYTAALVGADGAAFPNAYQDVYQNLCTGASLTLRIKLTYQENGVTTDVPQADYANFNFQWMFNGNPISGATNSTYIVNGNSGTYHCVLSQPACAGQTKNSYSATLNFSSSPYAYLSDVADGKNQLRNQCVGSTIKLSSSYVSNSATYSWYKDGVLLPNETNRILAIGSTGTYSVKPSDGACAISTQANEDIAINIGSSIENYLSFSADSLFCGGVYTYGPGTGDNPGKGWADGLTYQWLRNGKEIPGANRNGYYANQEGYYSLRVRQGTCESVSNVRKVKLAVKNQKPVISAPAAFASGITYRIYVDNPGNGALQWLKDDQPTTNNSYNYLEISTPGVYKVQIGFGDCAVESDPLVVVFGQSLTPAITTTDSTILTCSDFARSPYLSFNSKYFANTSGLTYRWLKNGIELPLSNFYADKNFNYPNENGTYQLRVSKGAATGLSNQIVVNSASTRSVMLTAQYDITSICQGNVIKLRIPQTVLSFYSGTSWVWKRSETPIPNQSSNTLIATQSGTYTATYQGNGCSITSEPMQVTVGSPAPTATLSGYHTIRNGETANLQLTSSAQGPYFFTLSDGTEYLGQALTTPVPKSPTVSTTYALMSFGTHCGPSPNASGLARIDVTNCAVGVINATLSGGTWTTPGIWSCGSIPTALDPVRISDAHTIALPTDYTATAKSVELRGNVQYNVNAGLKVGQE